jgi:hypothetical protein
MDELRPRGGRLVLGTLAVLSALGFLTLVMVQAMAFYAPAPRPATPTPRLLGPATKSDTVVRPPPLVAPREPEHWMYQSATKAGILGPLKVSPAEPAPPQQGTRRPRN